MRYLALLATGLSSVLATSASADSLELVCDFTQVCTPSEGCAQAEEVLKYSFDSDTFDAIARSDKGEFEVDVLPGDFAISFLKFSMSGSTQITTVNRTDGTAAHARQVVFENSSSFRNYYGTCEGSAL